MGLWALAYGAGLAAAFNPCGAAVLPSYLAYLLSDSSQSRSHGLVRGVLAGFAGTIGFLLIFAGVGGALSAGGRWLVQAVPWISVAVGAGLVILGLNMLFGWFEVSLPKFGGSIRPKATSSTWSRFLLYGVAYGAASLSCALPLFLAIVMQGALASGGWAVVAPSLIFAAGMGTVLTALTITVSLAGATAARRVTAWAPRIQQASAVVIVAAGLYVDGYWLFGPGGLV